MNRRHVLAGSMLGLISRGGINRSAAAHRRQAVDWTSALPDSITFERVTAPTADDLARVAMLASVTRNTWGPDANLSGVCFDFATGGPEFVIVEDGLLRVSVFDPQAPVTDAPDPPAQPTAFLAGDDHAPAPAPPSTQLELRPGDAMEFPDGSKCGKYGDEQDTPVVFLEVTFLPGSASEPDTNEDLDMTGELLQVGFGADANAKSALPILVAGRLRIETGGALVLEDVGMPLALYVEEGEAALNAVHEGALARDTSFAEFDASMAVPSGTGLTLVPGNHIYVPATASGTLSATSALSCLLVGLDFGAAASGG